MVPKTLFIAPQKTRYPPLIVFDPVVANVIIPFISNVLYRALDLCVRWEGHIYTYITLLILNIIMGYLGRNLHLTWLNLLMIVVQAFVLGMLGLGNWAYAYLAHLGILSGILLIVGVLSSPDWLRLSIALVVGGIGILYARKGKAANICNKKYAYDKMFTGIDKTLILLELAVLVLGGMIEMVGAAWGPLKHAIGNLPYILWISLHQFRGVVVYLGVGRAILAILITAVVTWIIDELIFSKFPRKGGLFGWIIDIARRAFKVILIVVLYALVSIYFGVAADIFGKALTEMLGNIVIAVILRSVFNFIFEGDFFKEETLYQHLFTPV
jgi:hypothetical protein